MAQSQSSGDEAEARRSAPIGHNLQWHNTVRQISGSDHHGEGQAGSPFPDSARR